MLSAVTWSLLTLMLPVVAVMGTEALIPHWENIVREFLFKTISPPPPANNKLYKALLEAPFYRGPFPADEIGENAETVGVLSRGDVYHLGEGGWIICQDGCVDCEICSVQKTRVVPTVKWTLRRIKRRAGGSRRPYDLQLTISPQADNSFHMKNISPGSYVYVTSNNGVEDSFTDDLIRGNKEILPYPFGTKKPQDWPKGHKDPEPYPEKSVTTFALTPEIHTRPKVFPGRKRSRDISQGERGQSIDFGHTHLIDESTPLIFFHPTTTETIQSDCPMGKDAKLILGSDQFGEKHLVHIVPAGHLDERITRSSLRKNPDRQPGQSRLKDSAQSTILQHEDRPLYRKIFRRVMDSLNTHKVAIEKFLFSQKVGEHPYHGEASVSPAAENVPRIKDEKATFQSINTEDEHDDEEMIRQIAELTSGAEVLLEDHRVTAGADNDTGSGFDYNPVDFDGQDSAEKNLFNVSGSTLILKEVAKSVVDHPADTLQGFNSVTNTTSLSPDSDNSLLTRALEEGTTPRRAEYSDRREKSRRHA